MNQVANDNGNIKSVVMYTAVNSDTIITGGIRRFFEIVRLFAEKGIKVHLFIPSSYKSELINNRNIEIYNIKRYESKLLPNGFLNFIFNLKRLASINKINYDVIIVFEISFGIQCVLLGLARIILFVRQDFIACRSIYYNDKNTWIHLRKILSYLYINCLILVERYVLKNVYRIVVQCRYDKRTLLNRHLSLGRKIEKKFRIIPNNINSSWILLKPQSIELNLRQDYLNLCFIGNVHNTMKGLHILLEALILVLKKKYRVNLYIFGAGKRIDEYQVKYKKYPEIIFFGPVDNMVQYLNNFDLLIVPSLMDSFPNVILEGIACEIPVIGSNRGGIPEMLHYKELLFNPDSHSLANKIQEIADNNLISDYKKLIKIIKKYYTFDWINQILINTRCVE